jgi:hypothetical protein
MVSASRRWLGVVLVAVSAAFLGASAVWSDTGSIGADEWQYRELDALAQAGLLSGHPKGPLSDWAGSLTRYEAASLTLRAVEGLAKAYQEQGDALYRIAQAETTGEAPAPRGVSLEDLARVEKLIEEFRAELVTMGARVDDLEAALGEVQERLGKVEAEQKKHRIDGYAQFRYANDDGTDTQEFLMRRTRVNLRGPASERVSYRVEFQLDAKEAGKARGSKVQLRTAYADYAMNKGTLRIGQAKIPWGYELLASVPNLWTAERALFMDRLFPNQRDIGVQWSYRSSPSAPQFDVGIFNGTGINASDNNDRKNVMARVDFPAPNGTVALSGYVGEDGADSAATDQDRSGLSTSFKWGETEWLGEFVTGKDRGHDVRGWYAQLGHPICRTRPNLLFAKYDQYDEDRDMSDDLFRRWSLGYWYEIDKATRLTLVHERRKVQPNFSELSKWDGNATYVQMQVKF